MIQISGSDKNPIFVVPYREGLELATEPLATSTTVIREATKAEISSHLPRDGVQVLREIPEEPDSFLRLNGVFMLASGTIGAVYGGEVQTAVVTP
jgi:hypothetical protein